MGDLTLLIVSYAIIAIVLIAVVLGMIKKQRHNSYKKELELLDREKNEIESAPVVSELAKLETIVKNDKMEEKYKSWFNSFEHIKNDSIPKINDMIIDLDLYIEKNDYKEYQINVAKTELAIYKAKMATDNLLDEIREINLSEEKYRKIVTKLKSKYRELLAAFEEKKALYEDIENVIELQFENIEKRFQDFEDYMEKSDYQEVFHIVKGIDIMIDHMGIVINEVPDLVLLANKLIPKRIEQITEVYEQMEKENYPLSHLKIEYNVEESLKNVNSIIDRIKVLNLENCMFELKTMLEYLIMGGKKESNIPNGFRGIIPSGTEVLSVDIKDGLLKINFSKELLEIDEALEEKMIEAIVYSLTSVDGVKEILIYVEGNLLRVLPKTKTNLPTTLTKNIGINKVYNLTDTKNITATTIYYIDKNSDGYYYIPVTKIDNNQNEKIKVIIDELSSGPSYQGNLMSFLNLNTKLLNYNIKDKIMELTFNDYIFDNLEKKKLMEEVLYTICLSIRDNYDVDEVVFMANGEEILKSVIKTLD